MSWCLCCSYRFRPSCVNRFRCRSACFGCRFRPLMCDCFLRKEGLGRAGLEASGNSERERAPGPLEPWGPWTPPRVPGPCVLAILGPWLSDPLAPGPWARFRCAFSGAFHYAVSTVELFLTPPVLCCFTASL